MAELEQRAAPPRIPEPSWALSQARAAAAERRVRRERLERSSMVRGLIALALLVLGLSMVRAGWDRVVVPGWWEW